MNRWIDRGIARAMPCRGLIWFAVCLVALAGCPDRSNVATKSKSAGGTTGTGQKPPSDAAKSSPNGTADEILASMISAYRKARTYSDDATMVLTYRLNGQLVKDEAPMSVRLSRPNKLRLRAFQVALSCDGRWLRSTITDELTNNVDNQFLVRPSPPRITLNDVLDDPLVEDQLGSGLVVADAGRLPQQLAFLLSNKSVDMVSGKDVRLKLLDAGQVDSAECDCVEVTTPHGAYRFWIDQQNHLLRKLEYPRKALVARLAESPEVKDVQLVAHFTGAQLDQPIPDSEFGLPMPDDAQIVRNFVPPPQSLPSDQIGQAIEGLELTTPDGAKVNRETLGNRAAVLMWFSLQAACEPALQQFGQVRKQFADDSRVAFYAVATEPSTVGHQALRDALRSWRAETPLARDLDAQGRDLLNIQETPTLVVLNGSGVLQLFEVGVNPNLAEQLPSVVEQVAKGEDVAAAILKQQRLEVAQYRRKLEIASSRSVDTVELANVPLVEATQPTKLQLDEVWTNTQLVQPGNMVVIESEGATPRLVVIDESRRLVRLDLSNGHVLKTMELDLPPGVSAKRLRTAVDREGRRYFAVFSPQGSHVALYDGDGKQLWVYPDDEARHDGIRDVKLADLDADGTIECYVGFLGAAGLHGVSIEGKRQWSNRTVGSIVSLTTTPPNPLGWRRLQAIGPQGQLLQFNQFGNADPPQTVKGWALVQLANDDGDAERATPYCGLGMDRDGRYCAVALNAELAEQWNYPLPEGIWRSAVELVSSTRLLGADRPGWLLAAVDGGLHVVSDDGDLSDHFFLGWLPGGVATVQLDADTMLLIASGEPGVRAWRKKGGG